MNMNLKELPPDWGTDEITKYLDQARSNAYATFHNMKPEYQRLVGIDSTFRKLVENLYNTKDWLAALFLLRSHSHYLVGISCAMSGQLPESYAALRVALEQALYGFYISKNPETQEIWLRRHDSEESKKKVRSEFQIRKIMDALHSTDNREADVAEMLYERTIDYGAHPNEYALMQTLQMKNDSGIVSFDVSYISGDGPALSLCLKTVAQVGVCILGVFRLVYSVRFDLIGLNQNLEELRHGL